MTPTADPSGTSPSAGRVVTVDGLPPWIQPLRLLGPGEWRQEGDRWAGRASLRDAADLAARLRGLGFAGRAVELTVTPPLPRHAVRDARTDDARRRRDTTPGFTRRGARLDEEGRYSLTPEALALEIGRRAGGRTILDLGCGCGGNTIGFARAGCAVVAVERDAARLELAQHNARVYGVRDRVRFVHGDGVEELARFPTDLVFVDPPWGREWDRIRAGPLPMLDDVRRALAGRRELWAKVPPSFPPDTEAEAFFGAAGGDERRVKFLLLRYPAGAR